MTGYGRGAATGENFAVAAEIKTVNNRYLDVHLRLSQEISSLEVIVKRQVAARLSRGRMGPSRWISLRKIHQRINLNLETWEIVLIQVFLSTILL